jgi:hypothetical protein
MNSEIKRILWRNFNEEKSASSTRRMILIVSLRQMSSLLSERKADIMCIS